MSRLLNMQLSWPATLLQRLRLLFEAHYHRLTGRRFFVDTADTEVRIDFRMWFWQTIMRRNAGAYWAVHPSTRVRGARFTVIGPETSPGWSVGCDIDGRGGLYVGDYTQVAPNVRLRSVPEDTEPPAVPTDFSIHIGAYGLIAMNATVGPGVRLGDFTIVGANSVVEESFPEGYCVIAGNPARVIERLDPAACERWQRPGAYVGYTPLAA
ncbi:MAG TPA: acyltransferase, partial [Sphingopyxis sp.]|nr:acyltransferase [Sphingopyxis sp.]